MKKYTLLIIIGGIFLILGVILYRGKGDQPIYYYVDELSIDEANALILDKTKTIMDIYENVNESFKTEKVKEPVETEDTENKEDKKEENKKEEQEDLYVIASNYDEVIDEIYTEQGKEELESITFGKDLFVEKKEDKVYILSKIPDNNSYLNSSIYVDDISIKEDRITATVSFTSDKVDNKDVLTYYVYVKDIVLIKKDDKWLVDTFIYSN